MGEVEKEAACLLQAVSEALAPVRSRKTRENPLRILVALSGGLDSHVLLYALQAVAEKENLELFAAHVNHGLRAASASEERFVIEVCRRYEIPLEVRKLNGPAEGENLEAWGREQRYVFFDELLRSLNADLIATAHNLNDQAETMMLRVLNGRLLSDARSIYPACDKRSVIRPLLKVNRKKIEDYARLHRLSAVIDASNFDRRFVRNRLRWDLLPKIEKEYNPAVIDTLALEAERLACDEDFLWERAAVLHQEFRKSISKEQLGEIPISLAWRLLSLTAADCAGASARLGYLTFMRAYNFFLSPSIGKGIDIGNGIAAVISDDGECSFALASEYADSSRLEPDELSVPGQIQRQYDDGSAVEIAAEILSVKQADIGPLITTLKLENTDPYTEAAAYFDADVLSQTTLVVRERSDGDYMEVWQRGGRKLKKLFQEKQLVLTLRDRIPIVESEGRILWVPGIARDKIAPVTEASRSLIKLRYRREGVPDKIAE